MLCVPILPVYLLSVSVYLCPLYLLGDHEKNWCGEGCNFEIITFDYISIKKKTYFTNVSKMCSTKYDLTYQISLCPKPLVIYRGYMTLYFLYQKTFRKIHYTNWSNYPPLCMLLYYNNTVVHVALYVCEFIVIFYIKITWENFCNGQRKHREFHFD